jgi:phosphoglucomutase
MVNIIRKGINGSEEISVMMESFRGNLPTEINNSRVIRVNDYMNLTSSNVLDGTEGVLDLESSNVLQFFLEDGSKISIRPSGTEPKIKFYFSVNTILHDKERFNEVEAQLEARIDAIIEDMNIL